MSFLSALLGRRAPHYHPSMADPCVIEDELAWDLRTAAKVAGLVVFYLLVGLAIVAIVFVGQGGVGR